MIDDAASSSSALTAEKRDQIHALKKKMQKVKDAAKLASKELKELQISSD